MTTINSQMMIFQILVRWHYEVSFCIDFNTYPMHSSRDVYVCIPIIVFFINDHIS